MNTTVSARIPLEIKRQGDRKLREIGSSATELINAAYAYVLEYGTLPQRAVQMSTDEPQVKTLSGDDARLFAETWNKRAILEARAYDGTNFKELLDQSRGVYYARLA